MSINNLSSKLVKEKFTEIKENGGKFVELPIGMDIIKTGQRLESTGFAKTILKLDIKTFERIIEAIDDHDYYRTELKLNVKKDLSEIVLSLSEQANGLKNKSTSV